MTDINVGLTGMEIKLIILQFRSAILEFVLVQSVGSIAMVFVSDGTICKEAAMEFMIVRLKNPTNNMKNQKPN